MDLTLEGFRDVVAEVIGELPAPLQPYLDRFEFDVSESPPPDEPDLGIGRERVDVGPSTRWGAAGFQRLTVFKTPFERAESEAQLRQWLRESLLEEITGGLADEDEEDSNPPSGGADLTGGVDIKG